VTSRALRFRCRPIAPHPWTGRYKRVPGETTAFHIRLVDGDWWPVADWAKGDEVATCRMVDTGDAERLVEAVNDGKAALGGRLGGAFLLDEYGRVLVPASDLAGTAVVVAGECSGPLRFHDPFSDGAVFDLYDDGNLAPGDPWNRPYIGLRHNLSAGGKLYFWKEDTAGARALEPPAQDDDLIEAIRTLRPSGAARFLVGVGGVVITKVPPLWEARYVGRLDLSTWFTKEVLS
jgi:hypothetical protein